MLEVKLTTEQKVEARISPVDAAGEKIGSKSKTKWTVVQGEGTVEVAKDGLSAFLVTDETPGETVFLIEVEVDGQDAPLYDQVKLVAFGANAERVGLAVGQPLPKTDPSTPVIKPLGGPRPISGVQPGPREK